MARLSILNMLIGFTILFIAACGGPFLAQITTDEFIQTDTPLNNWLFTLLKSAHGHTNLFGMIHILLGITLPYSCLSTKTKRLQTIGLSMGSFSMSFLLILRAFQGPKNDIDYLGMLIGLCLSAALAAIGLQAFGLYKKWMRLN